MKLCDVINFRKDLLFNGAVQISWFETDPQKSKKAAEHFVFHGPSYHGVKEEDFNYFGRHRLLNTANFTSEIIRRLHDDRIEDPFSLAIAGYGTGKSHLGITLSELLSDPKSETAAKIISNILSADEDIGKRLQLSLNSLETPFLVIPINGMKDFDLVSEITRLVFQKLKKDNLDTAPLENLRPRFKVAQNFVNSFFQVLENEFTEKFGQNCSFDKILKGLSEQDEKYFRFVSEIYEAKMGSPIKAVGQESFHQFLDTLNKNYCGEGKPYSGVLIVFDEFGRYLEFSVHKPHIAGSGSLQQLFEAVQENANNMFLLCFIQYELKAYISRVAPEKRKPLERYISRYDTVWKIRLSTNLETLIASLLEKKNSEKIKQSVERVLPEDSVENLMMKLQNWFPVMKHHALWLDTERFKNVILNGCWPLHPTATWFLYQLTSVGKSLQQRSAFSYLADAYEKYKNKKISSDNLTIFPVDLCNESMISEFLASEKYGQQGAEAHAYEEALSKHSHELSQKEIEILKAILLIHKIGLKVSSKIEFNEVLCMFTGQTTEDVKKDVDSLVRNYGLLEWNDGINLYEIIGDAVPRRAFLLHLKDETDEITNEKCSELFCNKVKQWLELEDFQTDFNLKKDITTKEWKYAITFSNVVRLDATIEYAFKQWKDSIQPDKPRGQLIYCYVGPDSDVSEVRKKVKSIINSKEEKYTEISRIGAPIAVLLLEDSEGLLGEKIAEYWVLTEELEEKEREKFRNFIIEQKQHCKNELKRLFNMLSKSRDLVTASSKTLDGKRLKNILTSLFETIYPKIIPFPFDGFHTIRGNAAKDCQTFTRELFMGNLNQSWIAGRNQRQKNRANAVLIQSWGVLSENGSISALPKNSDVRTIIKFIESFITSQKKLNIGNVIRKLSFPPFGCNIASAGLLLGVFVAARKEQVRFIYDSKEIKIENWLGYAIHRNFIELSIADSTYIQLVTEEESSKWQRLLDEWDLEETYLGQIAYLKKIKDLKETVGIPDTYYYRLKLLEDKARKAQLEIEKMQECLDKQYSFMEKSYKNEDAGNLSRCGYELNKLLEQMQTNPNAWTEEQFKKVKDALQRSRQATIQFFPKWLKKQIIYHPNHLGNFEHKMMGLIGKNLKSLKLESCYNQLEVHVNKIKKDLEILQRMNVIFDEVKSFVNNNRVTKSTKIIDLKRYKESIEKNLQELKKYDNLRTTGKFKEGIDLLLKFKENCDNQIELHQERAIALFNVKIGNLDDVFRVQQEVTELIDIYTGQERDLEDFRLMLKILNKFNNHYQSLTSFNIDDDDVKRKICEYKNEINRLLPEGDAPPWDIDEIYQNFFDEIQVARKKNANSWIKANVPDPEKINKWNAEKLSQTIKILKSPPATLSKSQKLQVNSALNNCNDRLDELGVEGLLARIQDLSKKAQRKLKDKLTSGYKNIIELLLHRRTNLNILDKNGNTPLHLAISEGFYDLSEFLLSKGAKVDIKNSNGETPIHLATKNNDLETIDLLISHSADVNSKNNNQETPLIVAIKHNFVDAANLLIQNDADINTLDGKGRTPLHWAVIEQNLPIAKILIINDVNLYAEDEQGDTALKKAEDCGCLKIAELINEKLSGKKNT